MAYDRVVDSAALDKALGDIAVAVREKTGASEKLTLDEMADAISGIEAAPKGFSEFSALTTDGLTLSGESCVKISSEKFPDNLEIQMSFTIPEDAYTDKTLQNKSFLSFAKDGKTVLEFGPEKYGVAWPAIRGYNSANTSTESELGWRYATDESGESLGNSSMWWSASELNQDLRLRLKSDGSGEFAMKQSTNADWHTWSLPAYGGLTDDGNLKRYPYVDSFDSIVIGNRLGASTAIPGIVISKVDIKEWMEE